MRFPEPTHALVRLRPCPPSPEPFLLVDRCPIKLLFELLELNLVERVRSGKSEAQESLLEELIADAGPAFAFEAYNILGRALSRTDIQNLQPFQKLGFWIDEFGSEYLGSNLNHLVLVIVAALDLPLLDLQPVDVVVL